MSAREDHALVKHKPLLKQCLPRAIRAHVLRLLLFPPSVKGAGGFDSSDTRLDKSFLP